jgi:two-component system, OmpR family, alkaline phosphatase synthesis response regulator PhoP
VLAMLPPDRDALRVGRNIRRLGANTRIPLLVLAARQDAASLRADDGVHDCLIKPFSVADLLARVEALTGAGGHGQPEPRPFAIHGVEIDPARRSVVVDGRPVRLTRHEFNLLLLLASHPGIVFTRRRLLSRLGQGDSIVTDRSVDALVKRLRRKIDDRPGDAQLIVTVWGDGYKFRDVSPSPRT